MLDTGFGTSGLKIGFTKAEADTQQVKRLYEQAGDQENSSWPRTQELGKPFCDVVLGTV